MRLHRGQGSHASKSLRFSTLNCLLIFSAFLNFFLIFTPPPRPEQHVFRYPPPIESLRILNIHIRIEQLPAYRHSLSFRLNSLEFARFSQAFRKGSQAVSLAVRKGFASTFYLSLILHHYTIRQVSYKTATQFV